MNGAALPPRIIPNTRGKIMNSKISAAALIAAFVATFVATTMVAASVPAGYAPYTGNGDPLGVTLSSGPALDALVTGGIGALDTNYVPYTGNGDPAGLTASN
jgi:hypothetical protein